ncbi:MAG TPA: hypothetical protein VKA94_14285, partial [Hyphomicrobiales bacterium]|nr:hypothetical protein [Hyphomicrobiales bacterium]
SSGLLPSMAMLTRAFRRPHRLDDTGDFPRGHHLDLRIPATGSRRPPRPERDEEKCETVFRSSARS